jgi:hypothetical protein
LFDAEYWTRERQVLHGGTPRNHLGNFIIVETKSPESHQKGLYAFLIIRVFFMFVKRFVRCWQAGIMHQAE